MSYTWRREGEEKDRGEEGRGGREGGKGRGGDRRGLKAECVDCCHAIKS